MNDIYAAPDVKVLLPSLIAKSFDPGYSCMIVKDMSTRWFWAASVNNEDFVFTDAEDIPAGIQPAGRYRTLIAAANSFQGVPQLKTKEVGWGYWELFLQYRGNHHQCYQCQLAFADCCHCTECGGADHWYEQCPRLQAVCPPYAIISTTLIHRRKNIF